jgi:hypothetical protein
MNDKDKKDAVVPITITIDNSHDAVLVASALMAWCCSGYEKADRIMGMIYSASKYIPIDRAVEIAIEEGTKKGFYFPKFMKPMLVHLLKCVENCEVAIEPLT